MTLSQDWRRTSIVAALVTTQTLAWASTYYLPFSPMQSADLNISTFAS